MKRQLYVRVLSGVAAILAAAFCQAISLGQIDDFQDGTFQGWTQGDGTSRLTNVETGGPEGAGDRFLRVVSTGGGFGPGSRPAVFNDAQWTGDWASAGVKAVTLHLKNEGGTPLHMRLVLFGDLGTQWTSTEPAIIPADNQWYQVTLLVTEAAMTRVGGTVSWSGTIASVNRFMVRHQTGPPSNSGTPLATSFGMDNVTAMAGAPVMPSAFNFLRGIHIGGNLQSLFFSDDDRVTARPGLVLSSAEAPVQLHVQGNAPSVAATSLRFQFEGHATVTNIQQRVLLFNFNSNAFEEVDLRPAPTTDTLIEIEITKNVGSYIEAGTGRVRALITWRQTGPVLTFPWLARADLVGWTVVP